MAQNNRPKAQNKYSEQYMQNSSFDEDYGVLAFENLVENAAGSALSKMQQPALEAGGVLGATADATVAAGATGSLSAKLRRLTTDLSSLVALLPTALGTGGGLKIDGSGTALPVQENGTQVQVDDAAFTPAASKIVMNGYTADETATDSVDEGDGGAARMTLDRKQISTLYPHTAGGLSTAMFTGSDGSSILTNAAQVIKASAGQLYGYYIYNPNSAATFVHFYNTAAASVVVGTTNPLFSLTIPATSAANLALPYGITFSNAGWSIAATTTAGGNSAPATGLDAIAWYI